MKLVSQMYEAYLDLCVGRSYPHLLVVSPAWHERLLQLWKPGERHFMNGAKVVVSPTEDEFHFEDIRE